MQTCILNLELRLKYVKYLTFFTLITITPDRKMLVVVDVINVKLTVSRWTQTILMGALNASVLGVHRPVIKYHTCGQRSELSYYEIISI